MDSPKKIARRAGFAYLVVVLSGIFSLAYVPSRLIVWDDAAQTLTNITNSELLFRMDIVGGVICYTAFLILPLILYQLLHHVSKPHAIAMVALAVVSVPIAVFNLVHKVNVLTLIDNPGLDPTRLQSEVLLYLRYYNNGIRILGIFWGLWLLPFGYLVYKSGILPRVLGVLLMLGCFGYLINFLGGFLFEGYADTGISRFASIPGTLGEIGICLWLLVVGVRKNQESRV